MTLAVGALTARSGTAVRCCSHPARVLGSGSGSITVSVSELPSHWCQQGQEARHRTRLAHCPSLTHVRWCLVAGGQDARWHDGSSSVWRSDNCFGSLGERRAKRCLIAGYNDEDCSGADSRAAAIVRRMKQQARQQTTA